MAVIKQVYLRFTPSVDETAADFKGYRIYSYKSPATYKSTDTSVSVAKGTQKEGADYKIPVSTLIAGLPVAGPYTFVVVAEDTTGNLSDEVVIADVVIDVTAPAK